MTKLNQALVGLVALIVLIAGGLMIYGTAERKAYLQAKGEAIVLNQQFKDAQADAAKQIAALTVAYNTAQADKDAALAAANAAENGQVAIQAALDALKALTAAMPPDTLSGAINQRIGAAQSWPTAGGVFTFTRKGAESTLNVFLDGEASASKYHAEQLVTMNLHTAIDAAEQASVSLGSRLTLTQGELDKAVAAWGATQSALSHLEHSILGTKIKTFVIGAGTGALALYALHILKVL